MFIEIFEGNDDKELMNLALKSFGDNKFGRKGVNPQKSKNHNSYLYEAPSKIRGVVLSTGWGHQDPKFSLNIDLTKAQDFFDEIEAMNLSDSIEIYPGMYKTSKVVEFTKGNKFTKRLVDEFSDSFYGYSDNDL